MDEPSIAQRVARRLGHPELVDELSHDVSGSDLTSLLLGVMAGRAGDATPQGVLDQYQSDRFVGPSPIDQAALVETEHLVLQAITGEFEPIQLAPLVPFGTHHLLGDVSQNNVVSTIRRTELAADPTAGLAPTIVC